MRCPVCNSELTKTIYIPPDNPDKSYVNYVCTGCRRRFRYATIRHLVLGDKMTFKLRKEEVIFNGDVAYFIKSKITVRKVGERFVLTAFGETMILRKFRNPPFPLSELR